MSPYKPFTHRQPVASPIEPRSFRITTLPRNRRRSQTRTPALTDTTSPRAPRRYQTNLVPFSDTWIANPATPTANTDAHQDPHHRSLSPPRTPEIPNEPSPISEHLGNPCGQPEDRQNPRPLATAHNKSECSGAAPRPLSPEFQQVQKRLRRPVQLLFLPMHNPHGPHQFRRV